LTYSTKAYLNFYAKWGIESHLDYAAVMASVAGSGVWAPLCGKYTKSGSLYQLYEQPIYDGQQPEWIQEHMDLSEYVGQRVELRFNLVTDNNTNYDGFYLDDVQVRTVQDTPTVVYPFAGGSASLLVYPNPASEQLQVAIEGYSFTEPLKATLHDGLGRVVIAADITSSLQSIDIRSLPANVYYLKIGLSGSMLPVQKVIVR
jgi:hypothetical protein